MRTLRKPSREFMNRTPQAAGVRFQPSLREWLQQRKAAQAASAPVTVVKTDK